MIDVPLVTLGLRRHTFTIHLSLIFIFPHTPIFFNWVRNAYAKGTKRPTGYETLRENGYETTRYETTRVRNDQSPSDHSQT